MTDENVDKKETTAQEGQPPDNVGGDGKTPATPELLNITQDSLNQMMGDRAKQAQRSLLKDLGVENTDTLKSMIEAHTQAEEKRLADEEASKSELEKMTGLRDASVTLQAAQATTIKQLQIENAIMRLAPVKDVPADRFTALLKLMDISGIDTKDGAIDDKDIEAAIDATLAENEFLKGKINGKTPGSPPSKHMLPNAQQPSTQQPVTRQIRKPSM